MHYRQAALSITQKSRTNRVRVRELERFASDEEAPETIVALVEWIVANCDTPKRKPRLTNICLPHEFFLSQ
jgi:hypothetical protein